MWGYLDGSQVFKKHKDFAKNYNNDLHFCWFFAAGLYPFFSDNPRYRAYWGSVNYEIQVTLVLEIFLNLDRVLIVCLGNCVWHRDYLLHNAVLVRIPFVHNAGGFVADINLERVQK